MLEVDQWMFYRSSAPEENSTSGTPRHQTERGDLDADHLRDPRLHHQESPVLQQGRLADLRSAGVQPAPATTATPAAPLRLWAGRVSPPGWRLRQPPGELVRPPHRRPSGGHSSEGTDQVQARSSIRDERLHMVRAG